MKYFEENLQGINKLSDSILAVLESQPGEFFAFLPEDVLVETIHEFKTGGNGRSLRNEVGRCLFNILNSEKSLSCVFDDFNSDLSSVENDKSYESNGIHYENEVYYLIRSGANEDLIIKCLQYSSASWHSLCVISMVDLIKSPKEIISEEEIKSICNDAFFVMIEAYDAESYVFWEKSKKADSITNNDNSKNAESLRRDQK